MAFSQGVFFGLITMLCWGVADFLQTIPTRKIGTARTMFFSSLIGLLPTSIAIIFFRTSLVIDTKLSGLLLIGSIFNLSAVYFFFTSFEKGEVSVVTPISASYSLVTIFLAFVFLGDRLSPQAWAAVTVLVIGIILTSTDIKKLKNLHTAKGVKESLLAMCFWGIYFFVLGIVSETYGPANLFMQTGVINGLVTLIFSYAIGGRPKKNGMTKNIYLILWINMVIYTVAWVTLNYGLTLEVVSLVAPISSLYPSITVLLAAVFYKEKLVTNQILGILLIFTGIVLLST